MSGFQLDGWDWQEPTAPQDMRDELEDRSTRIAQERDAAWHFGYDSFGMTNKTRDQMAALWMHPRLIQDFRDGWDTAASVKGST